MNGKTKAHVFLMEIILAILFFSVSAAVTLQLFVNAHRQSRNSVDLNEAVIRAQNVAEEIKASQTAGDSWLSGCEESFFKADDSYTAYYDENWLPAADATGQYIRVKIIPEERAGGTMVTAEISCIKDENTLYSLQVKRYYINR